MSFWSSHTDPTPVECPSKVIASANGKDANWRGWTQAQRVNRGQDPAHCAITSSCQDSDVRHFFEEVQPGTDVDRKVVTNTFEQVQPRTDAHRMPQTFLNRSNLCSSLVPSKQAWMCPEELKFEAKKYLDVLNSTCVFGLVPFKSVWSSGWVGGGGGREGV